MKTNWTEIVQTVTPHATLPVLLFGESRTGKTHLLRELFPAAQVVTMHAEVTPSDLLGQPWLTDGGGLRWVDGPATVALREGAPLIIDEFGCHGAAVEQLLHALLDDVRLIRVTLPTGETIGARPGFRVLATTNLSPSQLSQGDYAASTANPLLARIGCVVHVSAPSEGALSMLPARERKFLENWTRSHSALPLNWQRPPNAPTLLEFAHLCEATPLEPELIGALLWGQSGAEIVEALTNLNI